MSEQASDKLCYLIVLFNVDAEFDWDERATAEFDFPLVPMFNDWLNCLPDKWFNFVVVVVVVVVADCVEGIEGTEGIGSNSVSGVLNQMDKDHQFNSFFNHSLQLSSC